MSSRELISTALLDDPDPDGTDVYGMIPLIAELPPDEEDDEDDRDASSGDDDEEAPPIIEPSSLEIEIPRGEELPDDDDEALDLLDEPGFAHLTPGEARALVTYMRPLTDEEVDTAENPYLNDLRWTDDPSHTDDVLKAGKGDRGLDQLFDDAAYGENDMNPEERMDLHDSNDISRLGFLWFSSKPSLNDTRPHLYAYGQARNNGNKKLAQQELQWLSDHGWSLYFSSNGTKGPSPLYNRLVIESSDLKKVLVVTFPNNGTTISYEATWPLSDDNLSKISGYPLTRETINREIVSGLGSKLVVEHANWLADQDQSAGIAVRPRSYYDDVALLWAKHQLDQAKIPVATSGDWTQPPKEMARAANRVLRRTSGARSRFSAALGVDVDMGGWNPFHAIKSAVKSVEHAAEGGAKLAYRGIKFGVTKPLEYTYKGIKYVGDKAMQFALLPIKAVVRRFRGKMVNRKASELAAQRGLATPGPAEKADASTWAKNYTARSGNKFARLASTMMGDSCPESGMQTVNISLDEMGLAPLLLYPLIGLGAIGLALILDKIYNAAFRHSSAPPPQGDATPTAMDIEPGTTDSSQPPDAGYPAAAAPPDAGYPDTGYPDTGYPDASTDYDSSGRATVSVEQLQRMTPANRRRAQALIRTGRIHLT